MRKLGRNTPYEQLKVLTRGKKVGKEELHEFIKQLKLPEKEENQLLLLTPSNYIGASELLAKNV